MKRVQQKRFDIKALFMRSDSHGLQLSNRVEAVLDPVKLYSVITQTTTDESVPSVITMSLEEPEESLLSAITEV